jgi:SAM-dependent methyltransferase
MLVESDNGKAPVARRSVPECFDMLYSAEHRYWWRHEERYSPDPDAYPFSLVTQMTLRLIGERPGRVLDLGAGEGADSIRLALLGHEVTAVEISEVGAEKIRTFAEEAGASNIKVELADIGTYRPDGLYDVIICNGVLHYVAEKASILSMMQRATVAGGLNVISVWSTFTEVPDCHLKIPVYPEPEDGDDAVVAQMFESWRKELYYFERAKPEMAHEDMEAHAHSHIKMIARKPAGWAA